MTLTLMSQAVHFQQRFLFVLCCVFFFYLPHGTSWNIHQKFHILFQVSLRCLLAYEIWCNSIKPCHNVTILDYVKS